MKRSQILQELQDRKAKGIKSFTLLIDPDKFNQAILRRFLEINAFEKVDFIFVGGSLINGSNIHSTIGEIKKHTNRPVILFPGNSIHIDLQADAILFLSLISGRNPEFLIGQQVVAAPFLKKSNLEILPTGYMLIESGQPTTASYMSNTIPIPHNKPDVAACTALAGEMLGLKLIYADAGSGAQKPISHAMIQLLRKTIDVPLIIGGGIQTAQKALEVLKSGADMIVLGTAIEQNPLLIEEVHAQLKNLGIS